MSEPQREISVGDKVTWTHVRQSGSRMGFSARSGKVLELFPGYARVVTRNGRRSIVPLDGLRREGEETELTEIVKSWGRPS